MFGGKGVGIDWEWMRQKVTLDTEAGISITSRAWPAGCCLRAEGMEAEKKPFQWRFHWMTC